MARLTKTKAELNRFTALRQKELTKYNKDIQNSQLTFRAKARKLLLSKRAYDSLQRRVRHLEGDLSAAQHELKKVDQLTCEICFDKIKDKITKCGHTFRGEFVLLHAGSQNYIVADSMTQPDSFRCPGCRCILRGEDVKDIYWGDAFQEVVVLDSDIDSDSEGDDD